MRWKTAHNRRKRIASAEQRSSRAFRAVLQRLKRAWRIDMMQPKRPWLIFDADVDAQRVKQDHLLDAFAYGMEAFKESTLVKP